MHLPLWPLKQFLRTCPDGIHAQMVSHLANHLLRAQSQRERLLDLDGKRIRLAINDTGNAWQFRINGPYLVRDNQDAPWDVCIRGNLADFLLLATRAEDPDTLFFARRLEIEGDTETGLHVKNLIDAFEMDWPAHFSSLVGADAVRAADKTLDSFGARAPLRDMGENLGGRLRRWLLASVAGEEGGKGVGGGFSDGRGGPSGGPG